MHNPPPAKLHISFYDDDLHYLSHKALFPSLFYGRAKGKVPTANKKHNYLTERTLEDQVHKSAFKKIQ